jgi:transcriptional regulator with XRE-family HTH domain
VASQPLHGLPLNGTAGTGDPHRKGVRTSAGAEKRSLLEAARVARELTQDAVARRSGTSQPTLSAYQRGAKSPTLPVDERILHSLGFDLGLQPRVTFRQVHGERGGTYLVPDELWRVDPPACFAPVDGLAAHGERAPEVQPPRPKHPDRGLHVAAPARHRRAALQAPRCRGAGRGMARGAPRLSPELRVLWAPLVYAAGEAALERLLVASLRAGTPDPGLSPRRRKNLVGRLKARGLSADDVRKLVR